MTLQSQRFFDPSYTLSGSGQLCYKPIKSYQSSIVDHIPTIRTNYPTNSNADSREQNEIRPNNSEGKHTIKTIIIMH
jgi:hypothetical protein